MLKTVEGGDSIHTGTFLLTWLFIAVISGIYFLYKGRTKTCTQKGAKWEFLNSWWVFLSLLSLGMLSWISFLYIGRKVKSKRWTYWGFFYLAVIILMMVFPVDFLMWIIFGSIFHCYRVRVEYLIHYEVYMLMKDGEVVERIERRIESSNK